MVFLKSAQLHLRSCSGSLVSCRNTKSNVICSSLTVFPTVFGPYRAKSYTTPRLVSVCAREKYPDIYQSPYEQPPQQQQYGGGAILSEEEERDRLAVGTALRNIGWLSFWSQLTLTAVAAVILLFSIGVTSQGVVNLNLINVSTAFGVATSLVSTFLAWTYVQAGRKLGQLQEVVLSKVEGTVLRGTTLNLVGLGATLVGLQATVGGLVAKTLASASAGPVYRPGMAPPPVALDVFSVQACTNTVMAHFLAIAFSNWLLRVLNKYIQKESAMPTPSAPPMPPMV